MHRVGADSLIADAAQQSECSVAFENQFEARIAMADMTIAQCDTPPHFHVPRSFRRAFFSPAGNLCYPVQDFDTVRITHAFSRGARVAFFKAVAETEFEWIDIHRV